MYPITETSARHFRAHRHGGPCAGHPPRARAAWVVRPHHRVIARRRVGASPYVRELAPARGNTPPHAGRTARHVHHEDSKTRSPFHELRNNPAHHQARQCARDPAACADGAAGHAPKNRATTLRHLKRRSRNAEARTSGRRQTARPVLQPTNCATTLSSHCGDDANNPRPGRWPARTVPLRAERMADRWEQPHEP